MAETPFPLGRRVQFDERSRQFAAYPALRTPSRVKHRVSGARLNQEDLGACTGFALTACRNTSPNRLISEASYGNVDARRVYSLATQLDEFEGQWPPSDTGSSGLAACKAGVRLGLISQYQWCFGLDHMLGVLVKRPVIVGTVWLSGMFSPDSTGVIRAEGDEVGGHEYLIRGYDRIAQMLHGVNSWGRGWGVDGTFQISFADMRALLARDGDVKVPVR